jgi:hypothetical protein
MSDTTIENNAQQPRGMAASAAVRPRWLRRKPLVLATSCLAAAALATLVWQTAAASPPAALIGRIILAGAMGLASNADVKATPAAPLAASSPASSPAALGALEVPPAIVRELAELKAAHERLLQRSRGTDERLDRIEADAAQLRQKFEKSHAAHARVRRQARTLARQLRVAQAEAAAQAQVVQQRPKVLSVDTWNGRPSVSVQVGDEVRFFSEGDVIANALVRKADPATQRVEFVSTSGAAVTASAATGEAL